MGEARYPPGHRALGPLVWPTLDTVLRRGRGVSRAHGAAHGAWGFSRLAGVRHASWAKLRRRKWRTEGQGVCSEMSLFGIFFNV